VRIYDLSCPIDASVWEPDPVVHRVMSPAEGARHMSSEMKTHFGVDFDVSNLPDQEFLSNDTITLTSHTGTHVDAPSHYGSNARHTPGVPPRHIDQMPLDWFYRPGFVLRLGEEVGPAADADAIREALRRIDYQPAPYDIALLCSGADRYHGTPEYFSRFIGLDRSGLELLLDLGVRVVGTDGFSLDAPFQSIIERFDRSGDPSDLWPAHLAGRDREYCQIERLAGLDQLPRPYGFTVACLPVKVVGAGAGWTRAVAIFDD